MNSQEIQREIDIWEDRRQQATEAVTHLKGLLKIALKYESVVPGQQERAPVAKPGQARRPQKRKTSQRVTAKVKTRRVLETADKPLSLAEIVEAGNASGKKYSRQSYHLSVYRMDKEGEVVGLPAPKGAAASKVYCLKSRLGELEIDPKSTNGSGRAVKPDSRLPFQAGQRASQDGQ